MKNSRRHTLRPGFTLIEMMVSLTTASILLMGLSSALFIAIRTTDPASSPAPATIDGLGQLTSLYTELRNCLAITEQTATAITVSVPDRNFDSNPESIRCAWSGTAGDSLTWQYNGGSVTDIAEDVHDFDIQYYQPGTAVEHIIVRVQVTSSSQASVQTTIPLLNRP